MGRIDPPPQPSGRGLGSLVGWIVVGALAIALAVLLAFQAGKRSGSDRVAPGVTVPIPAPAQAEQPAVPAGTTPAPAAPPEGRFESAVMEVKLPPRPTVPEAVSAPTVEPSPVPAETLLHEKMARCLSFQAEDDEIHGVLMPAATQLLVTVINRCDLSFAGSEVWFEARATPNRGAGSSAREVGRFQTPIEARGRAETRIILSCARCYAATHRLEASIWWASGGGRTE